MKIPLHFIVLEAKQTVNNMPSINLTSIWQNKKKYTTIFGRSQQNILNIK